MKMRYGRVRDQQGAALVVVLLVLIIVMLLGLASMRDSIMQEKMAGYTVARGYAFQAAEAALREAEDFASGKPAIPASGCLNGVCASQPSGTKPLYESAANFWTTPANFKTAAATVKGIEPRFSLEGYGTRNESAGGGGETLDIDGAPDGFSTAQVYRITVLSRAANGTEVLLQSLYQAP